MKHEIDLLCNLRNALISGSGKREKHCAKSGGRCNGKDSSRRIDCKSQQHSGDSY